MLQSMELSRPEYWSGYLSLLQGIFPTHQCMKVKSESEVTQSCLTLSNPLDRSPPGSSVHGIVQARALVKRLPWCPDGKESACNAGHLSSFLDWEDPLVHTELHEGTETP